MYSLKSVNKLLQEPKTWASIDCMARPERFATPTRFQWKRNDTEKQELGNRQEVRRLTPVLFKRHVFPSLRRGYSSSLTAYQKKHSNATHISLVQVGGLTRWGLGPPPNVGSFESVAPPPSAFRRGWVVLVDSFDSTIALNFGSRTE
jgi:hypothetical protein